LKPLMLAHIHKEAEFCVVRKLVPQTFFGVRQMPDICWIRVVKLCGRRQEPITDCGDQGTTLSLSDREELEQAGA
jgi:hypothetical protein